MKIRLSSILIILFSGCWSNLGDPSTWYEISEIYTQRIDNSSKSIYQYDAWSRVNDGEKYGYAILDFQDTIGIRDIEVRHFGFLSDLPTKDTISRIRLVGDRTRIPGYQNTDFEIYKGLILKTDYYKYHSSASLKLTYRFSDFLETSDSLILLGLEQEYFLLPTKEKTIGFRKGNIKLIESDSLDGNLKQIEIPAFLLKDFTNSIIDKHTILNTSDLKVEGLVRFIFIPTGKISIDDFSNIGIYKRRKIIDKHKII